MTLIYFLASLDDEAAIRDHATEYLGKSVKVEEFISEFVRRRRIEIKPKESKPEEFQIKTYKKKKR
jgi:hypothetical protein